MLVCKYLTNQIYNLFLPFPLATLSTPSPLLEVNTDGLADSINDHIR